MQRKNRGDKQPSTADQSMLTLPDDVIGEIFKFSKPELILRSFSLVCRRFFYISINDSLWHFKLEEYFPFSKIPEQNNQSPLTVFKSNYTSPKKDKKYHEISHLFYALKNGDIDKLKKNSINLNTFFDIKDPAGKSLLDYAVLFNQQSVLDHIYELAKKVEKDTPELRKMTIFFWAVLSNQKDEVVRLIQEGAANVNENIYRITPLCLATKHGNLEMVKLLLEKGADINQADRADRTPLLIIASKKGDLEMVKLLLKKGANINQADRADRTPLFIAAINGHLEVVKALLKAENINVNQGILDGTAPLFGAAINGQLGVVDELIKAGAKLNEVDFMFIGLLEKQYKTPLFELKPGETLQEGILFLKPNSQTLSYPNLIINVSMIFALEKTHQHLVHERQDHGKALAIKRLIKLIYTDPEKSFSEHVMTWRKPLISETNAATNQSIVSAHSNFASGVAKMIAPSLTGLVGLFSASHSKALEKKTKTDTEVLIEDLEAHSKLWSGNSPAQENTALSIQLKNSSNSE